MGYGTGDRFHILQIRRQIFSQGSRDADDDNVEMTNFIEICSGPELAAFDGHLQLMILNVSNVIVCQVNPGGAGCILFNTNNSEASFNFFNRKWQADIS